MCTFLKEYTKCTHLWFTGVYNDFVLFDLQKRKKMQNELLLFSGKAKWDVSWWRRLAEVARSLGSGDEQTQDRFHYSI